MENLSPEFRELLASFLSALAPVLVAFLSGVAGLALMELRRLMAARLTQEQARTLEHFVRLGIFAAEQYLKSADGQAKKAFALRWIEYQLKQRGIYVDLGQISELIEAVVGQEKLNLAMVHPQRLEELVAPQAVHGAGAAPEAAGAA